MFNFIVAMLTAIGFGRTEQFTFNHGFQPGPPDFLKYFTLNYHAWILLIALGACWYFPWAIPLWVLLEDMTYFYKNPTDTLDDKDWITGGFGGFTMFGQFIPWTYVALAALSLILSII